MIVFWFRRDLRYEDNVGLRKAMELAKERGLKILPIFIFDTEILSKLEDRDDRRVEFIHYAVSALKAQAFEKGMSFLIRHGRPRNIFEDLLREYPKLKFVYTNHDYEPAAHIRDAAVDEVLRVKGAALVSFKDQVIFESLEVAKDNGEPYTVFTPYSKKWLAHLKSHPFKMVKSEDWFNFGIPVGARNKSMPSLKELGFQATSFEFPKTKVSRTILEKYHLQRDLPGVSGTSHLGLHLRFGTVSIRKAVKLAFEFKSKVWLSELIWREFFMQILSNFPHVVDHAFRPQYDCIRWRNDEAEFEQWREGRTGVPIVDAGMRELRATGFMHNRVRMIVASFLTKNLLIDWRWGEAHFARFLLDYELASNNGNWQWAAGTGCDAAPYFRIFNPMEQARKFDSKMVYIKKWVPEAESTQYPKPMVDLKISRARALVTYKTALEGAT